MKHYLQKRRAQGDGGFTLIELLIVIVILGILAAIVVFSTRGVTDRGQASACRSTINSVLTAAEAFRAQSQTSAYPANLNTDLANFLTLPSGASPVGNNGLQGNGWVVGYQVTGTAPSQAITVVGAVGGSVNGGTGVVTGGTAC